MEDLKLIKGEWVYNGVLVEKLAPAGVARENEEDLLVFKSGEFVYFPSESHYDEMDGDVPEHIIESALVEVRAYNNAPWVYTQTSLKRKQVGDWFPSEGDGMRTKSAPSISYEIHEKGFWHDTSGTYPDVEVASTESGLRSHLKCEETRARITRFKFLNEQEAERQKNQWLEEWAEDLNSLPKSDREISEIKAAKEAAEKAAFQEAQVAETDKLNAEIEEWVAKWYAIVEKAPIQIPGIRIEFEGKGYPARVCLPDGEYKYFHHPKTDFSQDWKTFSQDWEKKNMRANNKPILRRK